MSVLNRPYLEVLTAYFKTHGASLQTLSTEGSYLVFKTIIHNVLIHNSCYLQYDAIVSDAASEEVRLELFLYIFL